MRVVAIIAAFNEADVIASVVGDLIAQGVQVYFLDDGSTDGTADAVEPSVGRGVIAVERMPSSGARFDWERILRRKTELARELDADWFIHHDADEFRESPWPHLSLADAIGRVDAMGYNAIDFASLNFWPIHDDFQPGGDVRQAHPYYSEQAPYDRVQIRCWKKAPDVDLASSGGHEARFDGRKVFPVRFILRHYPVRGQAHGERKIFAERRARFRDEERARGWHVQYDDIVEGSTFVRDAAAMRPYDREAVSVALALRHRGVEELEKRVAETEDALGNAQLTMARVRRDLDTATQERDAARRCLEQRMRALSEKYSELAVRDAQFEELTADIERVRAVLEQRERQLAVRNAQFDELTADIERVRAVLEQRVRAILEQRDRELAVRSGQFDELTAHVKRMRDVIERRDRELTVRHAQFEELTAGLQRAHDALEARDRELSVRNVQYDGQSAEISGLRQSVETRSAEIERWRAALDDALRRLDTIERSASWRLTAPMRRLLRLLRGR